MALSVAAQRHVGHESNRNTMNVETYECKEELDNRRHALDRLRGQSRKAASYGISMLNHATKKRIRVC